MKIALYALLCFVILCPCALATAQRPDIVIYDGIVYGIHWRFPLESLRESGKKIPLFEIERMTHATNCHRGYVGIWEIRDDALFLKGIMGWQGDRRADLKKLFPKKYKDGGVKAEWFSGKLELHVESWRDNKQDVRLTFKNGEVQKPAKHKQRAEEQPNNKREDEPEK